SLVATITQPPQASGTAQWVQVINSFSGTYTPGGGTCTTFGLDYGYPYRSGTQMSDSPGAPLTEPYTKEQVSFAFYVVLDVAAT
ncbi:MAG: hypothetical protein ABSH09_10930, partial [Bryobacteraceae bacterium]